MPERDSTFDARFEAVPRAGVVVRVTADHVTVTRADGHEEHRLHVDDVAEVRRADHRLEIVPVRGPRVIVTSDRAAELDAALVAACRVLPELTRALHSLGDSRAGAHAARQREFFAPLLDARRRAEDSVARADVIAAFDADRMSRAFDAYLAALTSRSADDRPAARRAFAARADEAAEPLYRAIAELRRTGPAAAHPPDDARLAAWRQWTSTLQRLFAAADRCWVRLHPTAFTGSGRGVE